MTSKWRAPHFGHVISLVVRGVTLAEGAELFICFIQ